MEQQQQQPSSSATTTTTSSSSPSSSQRRELQGPRPAPLKVRKDSHKIRKPPGPPAVHQVRQPVIIYTVSPKVVHAEPSEFMSVVQRLTGARGASAISGGTASSSSVPGLPPTEPHHQIHMPSSPSLPFPFPLFAGHHHHHHVHAPSSSSSQLHFQFQLPQHHQAAAAPHQDHLTGQLSPAASLAAIEQASSSPRSSGTTATADVVGGGLPLFPTSILSPGTTLPAIPPSFFSPLPGNSSSSYSGGGGIGSLFGGLLSPAFLGGANNETGTGGGNIAGASHQIVTMSPSVTPSPSPYGAEYYWDLFNNQHRN